MNKNIKWYSLIAISVILLIIYTGYFFTDIGRGLEDDYNKDEILRSREFVMSGMGMMNSTPHPFHVHAVQFRIIERNGQAPPLNETIE